MLYSSSKKKKKKKKTTTTTTIQIMSRNSSSSLCFNVCLLPPAVRTQHAFSTLCHSPRACAPEPAINTPFFTSTSTTQKYSTTNNMNDIHSNNSQPSQTDQSIIVLMRHGTTDWNSAGRVQGNSDHSRLNALGIQQAAAAGRRLRKIPFDAVYCSPLTRARHTYSLLTQSSDNHALLTNTPNFLDVLTEIQFPWQGLLRKDIPNSCWAQHFAAYRQFPRTFSFNGFNPVRDVERRAQAAWNQLRSDSPRCALVVAHNQTNKALLASALGMHTDLRMWNQSNCCFNVFAIPRGSEPVLRLCNCEPISPNTSIPTSTVTSTFTSSQSIQQSNSEQQRQKQPNEINNLNTNRDSSDIGFRRSFRRLGYTRVILYHCPPRVEGVVEPLERLSDEMHLASTSTIYAFNGDRELQVARLLIGRGAARNLRVLDPPRPRWRPNRNNDNIELYDSSDDDVVFTNITNVQRRFRNHHQNESVSIITMDGSVIAAFFAAAFDLGMNGMHRVWSDAGGLSIIDIPCIRKRNESIASLLECFNIPLDDSEDSLLPYTLPVHA